VNRKRVIIVIGIAVLLLLGLYIWLDSDTGPDGPAVTEQQPPAATTASDGTAGTGAPATEPAAPEERAAAEPRTVTEEQRRTDRQTATEPQRQAEEQAAAVAARPDPEAPASDPQAATDRAPDPRPRDQETSGNGTAPAPDTAAPDTAAADTAAADTAIPDTAPRDTAAPDTAPPDTAPPDTAPPDTAVAERDRTEPEATGTGAAITERTTARTPTETVTEPDSAAPTSRTAEAVPRAGLSDTARPALREPAPPASAPGGEDSGSGIVLEQAEVESLVAVLPRPEPGLPDRERPAADAYPLPSFDIVRISRDCRAIIAGRAMPRAMVTISLGDLQLGEVMADARGEWVLLPDLPLQPGTGEIRIVAVPQDGPRMEGRQGVIVAVPDCGTEPGTHEVLAVQTDDLGQRPTRVLQLPGQSAEDGNLRLDTVDYDDTGRLILSGRAEPSTRVHIYANNAPVGQVHSDGDGRWSLLVDDKVPVGEQVLRLDQVTERGVVKSRVEFPFSRARFSDLDFDQRKVIVQPGNSLWRIARRVYGDGPRYTVIYQANVEQIRDPDLIYPGQIFTLPEGADGEERG